MKTLLLLLICSCSYGQDFLAEVNSMRIGKELTYDSTRQAQVDRYAASNRLLKYYEHSGMNCGEVIAQSNSRYDFVDKWRASPHHRKIMVDSRYKSMAYAIVQGENGKYYAVIQFYFER